MTDQIVGEGGAHLHRLNGGLTLNDGAHSHLYFIDDRLILTQYDGAHPHQVDLENNSTGGEEISHKHAVELRTAEGIIGFETEEGGYHWHEIQTTTTTLSGLHVHPLILGEETFLSLLPSDLLAEIKAAIAHSPFKKMNLKKSKDGLEMDYYLVSRLNKKYFRKYLKRAAERAQIKTLARLSDGLQIESILLSRERFSDMGQATAFILESDLNIKSSEDIVSQGVFAFKLRDSSRFTESSLTRIKISDGVEAVVGLLKDSDDLPTLDQAVNSEAEAIPDSEVQANIDANKMKSLRKKFKKTKKLYGM